MQRIHPIVALLMAISSFMGASIAFNVVVFIIHAIHLDEIFGWVVRGLAIIALLIFLAPLINSIERANNRRRTIVVLVALILSVLYLYAFSQQYLLITHWLYPYWPGLDDLPAYLRLLVCGCFALPATLVAYFMVAPSSASASGEGDSIEDETLQELGASIGEGLGEHFHHH